MFVAASSRCFSDKDFFEACQLLSDLEYGKLEIWMDEKSDHLKPSMVLGQPDRFIMMLRDFTRMTPIAFCLQHEIDITAFENLCKLCKILKITQITLPAGVIGTPFNEEIDRLRAQIAIVNAAGIRLSLKTMTGHLTEDPRTAVELCQSVQGLGITYDPSYYICSQYANQNHDAIFAYVYHLHLRDTLPNQLQVPVGLGEVDYARILSQLERYQYNRAFSVELLPGFDENERPLELRKTRMLLETLL